MKNRSERRHHEQRIKQKIKRRLKHKYATPLDDKEIGKHAAVHGSKCSCFMCGNPRKYYKQKTLQEHKQDANIKNQIKDL